jgi:hypothetical protein
MTTSIRRPVSATDQALRLISNLVHTDPENCHFENPPARLVADE